MDGEKTAWSVELADDRERAVGGQAGVISKFRRGTKN